MEIIDVHVYFGKWHHPIRLHTVDDTLSVMDRFGMTKAVLMSVNGIAYDFVEGNQELFSLIENQPRLFGYVLINLHYPEESLKEVKKYSGHPQYRGVKIHPRYSGISIREGYNKKLFDEIENAGRPILLHTTAIPFCFPNLCLPIAKRHPKISFVFGHMGIMGWPEAIEVAEQAENIYLDPSCSVNDFPKIEEAVKRVGADRVVFGSSMMENNPAFTIGMIKDAEISHEAKEKIFHKNAERIYGL